MSENTISPDNMLPPDGEESKKIDKIDKIDDKKGENPEDQIVKGEEIPEKEDINKETQEIQNIQEEETEKLSEKTEEEPAKNDKLLTQTKPRTKDTGSNYQISLINQNLLKVNVSTKSGVKINSVVKDRNTAAEKQNNEIYLYPKFDRSIQEVSVMISIEEDLDENENLIENQYDIVKSEDQPESVKETESKSNYQINLINENLLKIRIETPKGVKIDSVSRDKRTNAESQTNKIHLNPVSDEEIQIVEITIEIDLNEKEIIVPDGDGNFKLIPNPEVVDLIQPPTYPVFDESNEMYDTDGGYKNPFDALRKLIQKNTAIGITVAVAIHLLAAGIIFFNLSKKAKEIAPEEQSRLFIIQDLPDPKIKLENVEDPNKPPVAEIPANENNVNIEEPKREIRPRKTIKPPEIKRPERDDSNKDTLSESDLTRELDSMRRLTEGVNFADSLKDSTKTDTSGATFDIADSLRNNFNENDIGLAMYFPKNWKLTDQREINKSETEFKGVLLTDTTAEQPGTLTMFIYLDEENKDYNAEDFKTEFVMNDSTLTAFSKDPKTLAGFTEYRFYIFNKLGTEKLSLRASVRKQFFDQYKNEIEAVVRSIRIRKPEPEKKDSLQ